MNQEKDYILKKIEVKIDKYVTSTYEQQEYPYKKKSIFNESLEINEQINNITENIEYLNNLNKQINNNNDVDIKQKNYFDIILSYDNIIYNIISIYNIFIRKIPNFFGRSNDMCRTIGSPSISRDNSNKMNKFFYEATHLLNEFIPYCFKEFKNIFYLPTFDTLIKLSNIQKDKILKFAFLLHTDIYKEYRYKIKDASVGCYFKYKLPMFTLPNSLQIDNKINDNTYFYKKMKQYFPKLKTPVFTNNLNQKNIIKPKKNFLNFFRRNKSIKKPIINKSMIGSPSSNPNLTRNVNVNENENESKSEPVSGGYTKIYKKKLNNNKICKTKKIKHKHNL